MVWSESGATVRGKEKEEHVLEEQDYAQITRGGSEAAPQDCAADCVTRQ